MSRLGWVYALMGLVLAAAVGLAVFGYITSQNLIQDQKRRNVRMLHDFAEEKVLNIEAQFLNADDRLFDRVAESFAAGDRGAPLKELVATHELIAGFRILDDAYKVVPGTTFNTKSSCGVEVGPQPALDKVLPVLALARIGDERRHHRFFELDGEMLLYSYVRRAIGGKYYYLVIRENVQCLFTNIFPNFIGTDSRLYFLRVIDEEGVRFGGEFTTPSRGVVERGFSQTVDQWRLQVVYKDALGGGATVALQKKRKNLDFALIVSALAVIVVALTALVIAVRRERKASELKSEFISNVSHELKTPLSIISMFGELLAMRRAKSSEQTTEYAQIIHRESIRLSRLIDNVLDFAKIEKGIDVVAFRRADLKEVLERTIELASHRIERAGLQLDAKLEDVGELEVDSDALMLAVLNLIDNAIKYAGSGKRIHVGLEAAPDAVMITVRDFGPGIPVREHKLVFERFYRAKAARQTSIRGSGIGLALVKYVARAHRGRVEVDSREGEGTCFRLWIPKASTGRVSS